MAVLLPIWNEKRVTAGRIRRRFGAVMYWAVAGSYPEDNAAGEAIEPVRGSRVYPATVLTFEFLVLTACRSSEVHGALREAGRDSKERAHVFL